MENINTVTTATPTTEEVTVIGYETTSSTTTIPYTAAFTPKATGTGHAAGKGTITPAPRTSRTARRHFVHAARLNQALHIGNIATILFLGLIVGLLVVRHLYPSFEAEIPGVYRLIDMVAHALDRASDWVVRLIEKIGRSPKVVELIGKVGEFMNALVA